ncbi:MAG: YqeG family HAD IIIA-type phosphatase [Eubacterium sp.]|jgi:HAD superfamily phosphatase (TIGR01668 family)|nr:YqeG family HAD IIIA-type phosphatase [Eubacterium sp.]
MLFKPDFALKNVLDIDGPFLKKNNIKGLILDLDNTLSIHGSPVEEVGVLEWISDMRRLDIKLSVVSNNFKRRVKPLAEKLGLDFISFGIKPFTFGVSRAVKKMGLSRKQVCVVGDQIFTDVLAGNLSGTRTILVDPFLLETKGLMKLKRKIEKSLFKRKF